MSEVSRIAQQLHERNQQKSEGPGEKSRMLKKRAMKGKTKGSRARQRAEDPLRPREDSDAAYGPFEEHLRTEFESMVVQWLKDTAKRSGLFGLDAKRLARSLVHDGADFNKAITEPMWDVAVAHMDEE